MSGVAVPLRRKRRRPARIATRTLLYVTVIGLSAVFVLPLVWGFFNSLREAHQGVTGPAIPSPAHWDNYRYAWTAQIPDTFTHYLWNTVVLTALATIPAVFTSAFAGYAFARLRARGRNALFIAMLGTTFIPFTMIFIPFFNVSVKLGLYGTRWPWLIW